MTANAHAYGDASDTGFKMLGLDAEDRSWEAESLCAQTDPEAFFPEKGGSTREAKRVCEQCPVRQMCLQYALAHDERTRDC